MQMNKIIETVPYRQYKDRLLKRFSGEYPAEQGMPAKQAVNEAVDWAINRNLLNGLFKTQKEEVMSMSLTEFDEEEFKRDMRNEGREEKAIEAATDFLKENVSPEIISKCLKLPLEQVLELKKQIN